MAILIYASLSRARTRLIYRFGTRPTFHGASKQTLYKNANAGPRGSARSNERHEILSRCGRVSIVSQLVWHYNISPFSSCGRRNDKRPTVTRSLARRSTRVHSKKARGSAYLFGVSVELSARDECPFCCGGLILLACRLPNCFRRAHCQL